MKNKIILSLITVIFLGSCANKFSLTKRKYTKGYYFASSKNNNGVKKGTEINYVATKHPDSKKINVVEPTMANVEIKTDNASIEFLKTSSLVSTSKKIRSQNKTKPVLIASNKNNTLFHSRAIKSLPTANKPVKYAAKGDADVKFVVMVILCFFPFINLIPVYLHDGKDLTLNFLITLLLDFTFVLGIVFALLVVLDVIDLK